MITRLQHIFMSTENSKCTFELHDFFSKQLHFSFQPRVTKEKLEIEP